MQSYAYILATKTCSKDIWKQDKSACLNSSAPKSVKLDWSIEKEKW